MLALGFLLLAAQPVSAQTFNEEQEEEIGGLVREYLLENPGVIVEALEKFQQQEEERALRAAQENLEKHRDWLESSDQPIAGNPDGDVTVVEFFDYNCGYCKRALDDVVKIVESDNNVKFVLAEMPILGPSSETAARWALAAKEQGKYFDYHVALMRHRGGKSESTLAGIAEDLGLDVDQMRKDADSDKVTRKIAKFRQVASDLGISGTPAFIVGDQVMRGYVGDAVLRGAIRDERNNAE